MQGGYGWETRGRENRFSPLSLTSMGGRCQAVGAEGTTQLSGVNLSTLLPMFIRCPCQDMVCLRLLPSYCGLCI